MKDVILKLLTLGTKPSYHEVENRSISVSSIIYVSLPIVYISFMILDLQVYLNMTSWPQWDQYIVPIFILMCFFFVFLNYKHLSLLSRFTFLLTWPLAMHIIPIIVQDTPSDYYLAFPIGLIFHAIMVQALIRRKRHPILFYLLLTTNFLLTLYFADFLFYFDEDLTSSAIPFVTSRYYHLDEILYWLLFNLIIFYLLEALDFRDSQLKERHDQLYSKNSLAGISFWIFKDPMPTTLSKEEQIIWTKKHFTLNECNDQYAKNYAYNGPQDIIGKSYFELLQKNKSIFNGIIQNALKNNWSFFFETEEINKNGETVWFQNWFVPSIKGSLLTAINITQIDISKQKMAEVAKNNLLKDLEKYAFLNSHQLRAPLANILGITEILNKMKNEENLSNILGLLKTSAQELDDVIHEMNDILSKSNYQSSQKDN